MVFHLSLPSRRRQPEIMDQPGLDEARHVHALQGLERINRWSGSGRLLWPELRQAALRIAPLPLRVLDIATGAGDVPLQLWRKARQAHLSFEISGCDRSETALAHARRSAQKQAAPLRFFTWDILGQPLRERYDVVMCSLFLHHLDETETVRVLQTMAQCAEHLVLVNDLRRSAVGWWMAYVATCLLSQSPVVRCDGPVSVEGAYTCTEILELAQRAGLVGARVERCWPCRFLLSWWKQ